MRVVVVVPTYQEAENITPFLARVRETVPDADILVVDDDSPDGTGELAEKSGADLGQIQVLHRRAKKGLGAAYRAGFAQGVADEYDVIVQMDCDFSHDPAAIPRLLAPLISDQVDCAIGSRYVPGGSTPNWPRHRIILSKYGNRYTAALLGLGVHDATTGFRAYRADSLSRIRFATTRANGYAFLTELTYRMTLLDMRMAEVPITFTDRAFGSSKMSGRIITESMVLVTFWGIRGRLYRLIRRARSARR